MGATESLFEARFVDERGEEVRVPLHEVDVVRGNRKVASFRQNGWFTTEAFLDEFPAYSTDEVEDLGDARSALEPRFQFAP